MYVVNQILNSQIKTIINSSQLNLNDSVNMISNSVVKEIGGNTPIGDMTINAKLDANTYHDQDLFDQFSRWIF